MTPQTVPSKFVNVVSVDQISQLRNVSGRAKNRDTPTNKTNSVNKVGRQRKTEDEITREGEALRKRLAYHCKTYF